MAMLSETATGQPPPSLSLSLSLALFLSHPPCFILIERARARALYLLPARVPDRFFVLLLLLLDVVFISLISLVPLAIRSLPYFPPISLRNCIPSVG